MDNKVWGVYAAAAVVALALAATATITGAMTLGEVRANSCDADAVCEVNNTVYARGSALTLRSGSEVVRTEGNVEVGTTLTAGTSLVSRGSLSVGSVAGGGVDIKGNTISGRGGDLMLTSTSGHVNVKGTFTATGGLNANSCSADSACEVNSTISAIGGPLRLFSVRNKVAVSGTLQVTGMSGNGTAYVCVDANGKLFRSAKPCV